MYFSEQGNVDDDATLITIFLVSFNLQSCCLMQSAVCSVQSAVCGLLSANVIPVRKWTLQTTVTLVIRKPSFPDFLATPFSQIQRSFSSFAGNVKNLKRVFDFVSSCLPPSWNTIHLKPRFHSNRKPEIGIMQDFYSLSISLSIVKYIGDPFLDPCRFCLYQWFT